jgi:hypothetical protein
MEFRTRALRIRGAGVVAVALLLSACGGGGGGNSSPSTPPPPPPPPTVSLTVAPTSILEGDSVQLTWSSTGAASCLAAVVAGAAVAGWDGQIATSGTLSVGPLDRITEFGLNCSTGPGGSQASVIRGVQVTPSPPTLAVEIAPAIVREGQTAQISWSGNRLTSCAAGGIAWSGPRPAAGTETIGPFAQAGLRIYDLTCTTGRGDTISDTARLDARTGTNQQPVANAGADHTAGSGHQVELQGFRSSDDHEIVAFAWTQVGGPAVSLGPGNSQASASFTSPTVDTDTVLTFALSVSDDEGLTSTPDTIDITVLPIPPIVTLSGNVSFQRVLHGSPRGTGLDYSGQPFEQLSNIVVEVLEAATQDVIASGAFPTHFHFDVPSKTDLQLRVRAVLSRQAPAPLPHWEISVRDLDEAGDPIGDVYAYTTPVFNSGPGGVHDLEIPSGWSASGQLVGPRAAAPFAILDSISVALERFMTMFPRPDLPPLVIDWSPNNTGGDTFFDPNPGGIARIVLAGEQDVDTDEYDQPVILHEFGHFVMDSVSRDDSPGGPHAFGELVDMRLALSEGFATAFAASMARDSLLIDSFGPGQGESGFFDIGLDFPVNEGWYSEASVQELIWDISDFDAIWVALHDAVRTSDAMVSPFVLFTAYKQLVPSRDATVNFFLEQERIVGATIEPWGSTETNNAGLTTVLPVYKPISLGSTVQLRSTNETGSGNKLTNSQLLRLSLSATTNVRFQVHSVFASRDADLLVFHRGVSLGPAQGPSDEDFSLVLGPGEYVLDVFDCGNVGCNADTPASVDITVTVTAN